MQEERGKQDVVAVKGKKCVIFPCLSLLALSLSFFPLLFSLGGKGVGRGEREGVGRVAGEVVGAKGVTVGVTREVAVVTAEAWEQEGGEEEFFLCAPFLCGFPFTSFFLFGPRLKS